MQEPLKNNTPPLKLVDTRSRKYITPHEAHQAKEASRKVGRHKDRDYLMMTMLYRHAFRVSELAALRWDQILFEDGKILVKRLKGSKASTQYLEPDELRALRRLKNEMKSDFVFVTEKKNTPMSPRRIHEIVQRAGKAAGLAINIHPHTLRHAKGFMLANKGEDTRAIQDYLGHKNINHTIRYTEMSPKRFRDFGSDR